MRIVYVAWHGSIHTRRWVSFFAERGHEVHVVTCGDGVADLDDANRHRYTVHDLGAPRGGKLGYLTKILPARRLIRRLQPEVVHAHFATSYGMLALMSKARPLVVTAHGDDLLRSPRNPVMRRIVRRVLLAASLVTVPSEQMRDVAVGMIGESLDRPIVVFQYGVETQRLAELGTFVQSQRQNTDQLRIVSARPLLNLYRIDALLDAVKLLVDDHERIQLDILGDGPQRVELEEKSIALGIQNHVNFHGHKSSDTVERMVAGADIYVSVAESDGVSLALLEAMALGVTPVLSDIPSNQAWIEDGLTGALVAIEPAAIASGIKRARRLSRLDVARVNRELVFDRADRDHNLAACEILIDSLIGVTFDSTPIQEQGAA